MTTFTVLESRWWGSSNRTKRYAFSLWL